MSRALSIHPEQTLCCAGPSLLFQLHYKCYQQIRGSQLVCDDYPQTTPGTMHRNIYPASLPALYHNGLEQQLLPLFLGCICLQKWSLLSSVLLGPEAGWRMLLSCCGPGVGAGSILTPSGAGNREDALWRNIPSSLQQLSRL